MTKDFNRDAIGKSFSRAAQNYDAWALPQSHIAHRLAELLDPEWAPQSVLDIGCGSGMMTALTAEKYQKARLHGLDLAHGMIDLCRERWRGNPRFSFEVADAEAWETDQEFDLIVSSSSLQWIADIPRLFSTFAKALRPGGRLALALPVAETLNELDAAHRHATGQPLPTPPMRPGQFYSQSARAVGFFLTLEEAEARLFSYPTPLDVLCSLRQIGATLRDQPGYRALTPSQMRKLVKYYEKNFTLKTGDVGATYETLNLIAEKQP